MKIIIAGGRGFVGHALSTYLTGQGHEVWIMSRRFSECNPSHSYQLGWQLLENEVPYPFDVVINLCGENIAAKRWTTARKKALRESRINTAHRWQQYFARHQAILQQQDLMPLFLNASAVGFYADGDQVQDELHQIPIGQSNFAQRLVVDWEEAVASIRQLGIRVSCLRFGVVLGRQGGMLKQLLPSFRFGLGAVLGRGHTHLSWVHVADVCTAVEHIMQQKNLASAYNITAPNPCTQQVFADSLAAVCRRPRYLQLPEKLIRCLWGEMGQTLLLANQRVMPALLRDSGFVFQYPEIQMALSNLLMRDL